MTPTSPDLPGPNRRGSTRDATMSHTITVRPRKRRLGGEQRRALRLLAISPFGAIEAIMHVHGFTPKCSPSSSAPGLQLHRARPARRLRSAVSGSRMPVAGRRGQIRATGSEPV
jgi:hypothetical protein